MTAVPIDRPRGRHKSTDIPRIRLFSWLGLESIIWSVIIAHLVKWAVSFGYFAAFQVKYLVGYGTTTFTVWYLKDWWDRLPVHIQNLLGAHWFSGQAAPLWWVTWRHDIRDVGIVVIATIIIGFLFAKPKYPYDDNPGLRVYLTSVPLAILAALVPIAIVGVLAWKLPWLMQHGLHVHGNSVYAADINGWLAAGTWITIVMGITGGLAAKLAIHRVADDIGWFFAGRSAGHVRSTTGLDALRGDKVFGTPSHRLRVHWLLDHVTDLPERSPWLTRGLLFVAFLTLLAAGAGAWLNLVGPAAPH
jgi:hypothetical protein